MSWFYNVEVTRNGAPNDAAEKVKALRACESENSLTVNMCSQSACSDGTAILEAYDFVGITEQFDESLVLLSRQLGVPLTDLLYLPTKVSGQAATDKQDQGKVQWPHPPLSEEPAEVQEAAKRLAKTNDGQLVRDAKQQFDEQVAAEGGSFPDDVAKFKNMLRKVAAECSSHFKEACYWNDNGCGEKCIDELVLNEEW